MVPNILILWIEESLTYISMTYPFAGLFTNVPTTLNEQATPHFKTSSKFGIWELTTTCKFYYVLPSVSSIKTKVSLAWALHVLLQPATVPTLSKYFS